VTGLPLLYVGSPVAEGGSACLYCLGAAVDEQVSNAGWEAFSAGACGDVVGGLRRGVGGEDSAEGLGGGAAAAAGQPWMPSGCSPYSFCSLGRS
jgi:hypothetical protein